VAPGGPPPPTATFFLVGRKADCAEDGWAGAGDIRSGPVAERYAKWVTRVVESGLTDWGQASSGAPVARVLAEGLPVTAGVGLAGWAAGWAAGLLAAAVVAARWPALGRWYTATGYPLAQAVPPVVVVLAAYLTLLRAGLVADPAACYAAGVVSTAALLFPSTSALALTGLRRVLALEFIRAARARGLSPGQLFRRHVARHLAVSSGMPVHAAVTLAVCLTGSMLVEKVFSLGGVGSRFVEAVTKGQAELAATLSLLFYAPLVGLVTAARATVRALDPAQEV
jgi:oligopeptide transport system permease protein